MSDHEMPSDTAKFFDDNSDRAVALHCFESEYRVTLEDLYGHFRARMKAEDALERHEHSCDLRRYPDDSWSECNCVLAVK